jgi:hypothetical protein
MAFNGHFTGKKKVEDRPIADDNRKGKSSPQADGIVLLALYGHVKVEELRVVGSVFGRCCLEAKMSQSV